MDLSLIIPARNEESRIRDTLEKYISYLKSSGLIFEIIVEMDGCTDKTSVVVQEFCRSHPEIKHVEFADRLGKGGGLLKGFEIADGDYISFVDADGSVEPAELIHLLDEVRSECDVAIASRRAPTAVVIDQPKSRKYLGRCFNTIVRVLFVLPFRDTQCGAKVFKRDVLEKTTVQTQINGFAFDVSLLYLIRRNGFHIKEVGIRWVDKDGSKVDIPHTTADMLSSILRLRLFFSPFKFLVVHKEAGLSKKKVVNRRLY